MRRSAKIQSTDDADLLRLTADKSGAIGDVDESDRAPKARIGRIPADL